MVCALWDLRESADGKKSYFKSEVVAKGSNTGWALWGGYSSTGGDSPTTNFEYRLVILKFESGQWKKDKDFFWKKVNDLNSTYTSADGSTSEFTTGILNPPSKWSTTREKIGDEYATRKIWSGIGHIQEDKAAEQITDSSVSWTTCEQWGSTRRSMHNMPSSDEDIKEACYVKPAQ